MSNTIQPQELRLGNWVLRRQADLETGKYFYDPIRVDIDDIRLLTVRQDQDIYLPIPLTEEILAKCGLYKVNHIHGYSFWTMDRRNGINKWKPFISIYERYTEYCGHIIKPITCLHELQNTFYYTSGRELEIKL